MDLAELRRISLSPLLDRLGRDSHSKKIRCINPSHDDKKPSMVVFHDDGRMYCHSCGWKGDALDAIQLIDGIDFSAAVDVVAMLCGVTLDKDFSKKLKTDKAVNASVEMVLNAIHKFAISNVQSGMEHVSEYFGCSLDKAKEIASANEIGYLCHTAFEVIEYLKCEMSALDSALKPTLSLAGVLDEEKKPEKNFELFCHDRLIFPLVEYGRLVNLSARSVKDETPKMTTMKGQPSPCLIGIDDVIECNDTRPLVIVEGEGDMAALKSCGFPIHVMCSRGVNAPKQEKWKTAVGGLVADRDIVWLSDNDPMGQGYNAGLAAGMAVAGLRIAVVPAGKGKDARDWVKRGLTWDEFQEALTAAKFPREMEENLPFDSYPCPPDYRMTPSGVEKYFRSRQSFWQFITNRPIWIDNIGTSSESSKFYAVVGFVDPLGKRKSLTVPADELNDPNRVGKFSAYGLDVHYDTRVHISDYLSKSVSYLAKKVRKVSISERLGWLGHPKNPFPFIYGTKTIGHSGLVPYIPMQAEQSGIIKGIHCGGSFEEWRQCAKSVWDASDVARFCLTLPFVGMMIHPFLGQTFMVYLYGGHGRTSTTGKSTMALMALSVHGDPDLLKQSFSSTPYGVTEACSLLSDTFIALDERQVATSEDAVRKMIYMVASGKTKLQGLAGGGTREQKSWRIVGLATGEEPMKRKWDGEYARIIELRAVNIWGEGEMQDQRKFARAVERCYKVNYGWAGRMWVDIVTDILSNKARREEFQARIDELEEDFAVLSKNVAMVSRLAPTFAIIVATGEIVAEKILEVDKVKILETCLNIFKTMADNYSETDVAKRAVICTSEWINRYQHRFWNQLDNREQRFGLVRGGFWGEGHTSLLVGPWEEAMETYGIDPNVVKQVWKDRGWLILDKNCDGRPTKVESIDGRTTRVLAIRNSVIRDIIGIDESDESAER